MEGGDGYEGKGGEEEGDLGWIKYSTETPYVPHQASTLAQGPWGEGIHFSSLIIIN